MIYSIRFACPHQPAQVWALFLLRRRSIPGKTLCATKTSKVVLYLWRPGAISTRHVSIPGKTLCATKTSKVVFVFLVAGSFQKLHPVLSARCCIILFLRDRYHWITEDLKWYVAGVVGVVLPLASQELPRSLPRKAARSCETGTTGLSRI